jgi:hypothetical protein
MIVPGSPYKLDFGSVNVGGAPVWLLFVDANTNAPLAAPLITEVGQGLYQFVYNWATSPAGTTAILFKASLNGVEQSDVIYSSGAKGLVYTPPVVGATPRFSTAGDVVNRAAKALGLGTQQDPFQWQQYDTNWAQLIALLAELGQELVHEWFWTQLRAEWVFTTQPADTGVYALPTDWEEMIPNSGWNRTNRLPLGGPLSEQEWQFVKAWAIGLTPVVLIRPMQNELWLYPQPPPSGQTVALAYKSTAWVVPAINEAAWRAGNSNTLGANGSDTPVASGDYLLFDPLLLVHGLKYKWRDAKKLDATSEMAQFQKTLRKIKGHAQSPPILSLEGPRLGIPGSKLIGVDNLPFTGYAK